MTELSVCRDGECTVLAHVLEHRGDVQEVNKELLAGQHSLDKSITKLTENVCEIKRMGKRLEKLEERVRSNERTLWKVMGILSIVIPFITLLISHVLAA